MMPHWLYTLRERFSPSTADGWSNYLLFSGFKQIEELVTLDHMLCGNTVEEVLDEDWDHNVHEDFRLDLFRDAEYPLQRHEFEPGRYQLLAVCEQPAKDTHVPDGFTVCGHDIMDSYVGNSTLTNCGRIPEAFTADDVNRYGLIDHQDTAYAIRDKMGTLQPEDPHLGDCEVWLLARTLPDGG